MSKNIFDFFGSGSRTVYLCQRNLVDGISVDNETGPTEANVLFAQLLVDECNERFMPIVPGERKKAFGPCSGDCQLNELANKLPWYRSGKERG